MRNKPYQLFSPICAPANRLRMLARLFAYWEIGDWVPAFDDEEMWVFLNDDYVRDCFLEIAGTEKVINLMQEGFI